MSDYFLKAADEAALRTSLLAAGLIILNDATIDEQGEVLVPAHDAVAPGIAIDIIGTITKPTGNMIVVEGVEVPEMAPIPGYHANLRGELSDEQREILAPLLLPAPPAHPYRVWAEMPPPVEVVL